MSSIVANANLTSMTAQMFFNRNTSALESAMNRLSTGQKINTAKDDPAGMAIAERLNLQIVGNNQVTENIQTGISVINIAEGSLTSILNDLNRIRDLALQGSNNYYTEESQNAMLKEMQSRIDNINQIALSTEFNGKKLLDGSVSRLLIQSGFGSDASINTVDLASAFKNCQSGTDGLNINLADAGLIPGSVTADDFANYLNNIDSAISKISSYTSDLGSKYNKLDSVGNTLSVLIDNQIEAKSSFVDANIATESSNMIKYQILQQCSLSVLTQANSLPAVALNLLNK